MKIWHNPHDSHASLESESEERPCVKWDWVLHREVLHQAPSPVGAVCSGWGEARERAWDTERQGTQPPPHHTLLGSCCSLGDHVDF